MSTDPFTEKERLALAKLDEAAQLVYALPSIRESEFHGVVIPAVQAIQQLVYARATYRRARVT